ncbi:hypothetical protein LY78DRAFT_61685 [Colletotrichum sublineola]|nr:hypothetical protein LY78DRAFT_61685 [Colletotrichum sublineola]
MRYKLSTRPKKRWRRRFFSCSSLSHHATLNTTKGQKQEGGRRPRHVTKQPRRCAIWGPIRPGTHWAVALLVCGCMCMYVHRMCVCEYTRHSFTHVHIAFAPLISLSLYLPIPCLVVYVFVVLLSHTLRALYNSRQPIANPRGVAWVALHIITLQKYIQTTHCLLIPVYITQPSS